MKLGLSTAAFYGRFETEDAADHMQLFPLDTCEVFLETFSEYTPSFARLVREKLRNLRCTSVHPKGTGFEGELFAQSWRQRQDAETTFRRVLECAEILGASYYVFHGPGVVRGRMHPGQIREVRPVMRALFEEAEVHGVELLWENVSWRTLQTPEDVLELRDMFPDMGFVLDTKQANQSGVDPVDLAKVMGDALKHVHVLDWTGEGQLCLPGKGCMDWGRFLGALGSAGYSGAVILEPYGSMGREDEPLRESLDLLRRMIAEVNRT